MTDSIRAEGAAGRRAGIVAVVGRANVGKSSLVNAIVGEKVSIVTPVAQTTRHRIRAILNEPRGQLVLLDTPGVHRAASDLGRLMNRAARQASDGVDVIMLVLDASMEPRPEDEGWMKRIARPDSPPALVVVNKADLGRRHARALRAMWDTVRGEDRPAVPWLDVSAATGEGLPALIDTLFGYLPEHENLFPDDVLTDFPRKLFMADVVREKLIGRLNEELPHRVAIWIEDVQDADGGGWHIPATIYVERPSQKGIVIGHKGRLLRAVRRASEAELSAVYERPVKVELLVKVEPNWTKNYFFLQRLGMTL